MKCHDNRIRAAKADVDNKQFGPYHHVSANLKGRQIKTEKALQIAHDNQLLVHKLQFIAKPRPSGLRHSHIPGVKLDASMQPKLDIEKTLERLTVVPMRHYHHTSQLKEINRENERIERKLLATRGHYSREEFRQDAASQQKYLGNCRKFKPDMMFSRASTPTAYRQTDSWVSPTSSSRYSAPPTAYGRRQRFASMDGFVHGRGLHTAGGRRPQYNSSAIQGRDNRARSETPDSMAGPPPGMEGMEPPISMLFADDADDPAGIAAADPADAEAE
eukprot:CAMPEP_0117698710 /NCGR_PEP_ID=MMETSP0804-20121206/29898_1 /TAXON_ID=1074897 /ORGANISM="Tetraselmis astigmatica, Strain CCMP880" /LENGTH=273 /DNA_ID=CAMNT_0005513027 /DNA_START=546 /DNA_END=1367 /DNA_ORIENTATION=+